MSASRVGSIGQAMQERIRQRRVGIGIGKGPLLSVDQRLLCAFDDIGFDDRFGISLVREQVRAEQGAAHFFKQQPGLPIVRGMRRLPEAHTRSADCEHFVMGHDASWTDGHIVYADQGSNQAAERGGMRRDLQPFVQHATFIRFIVAE